MLGFFSCGFMCNAWFLFLFSVSLCFVDCVLHVLFASCAFTDRVSGLSPLVLLLSSNK